jgi:hypothetical protein
MKFKIQRFKNSKIRGAGCSVESVTGFAGMDGTLMVFSHFSIVSYGL